MMTRARDTSARSSLGRANATCYAKRMDAQAQLDEMIDRFTPEIAALTRALLARMKARIPGATIGVYDNYSALGIGFGRGEKASNAVVSIVAYPRWVRLFFLKGADLPDPHGLLEGKGSTVRSIICPGPEIFDDSRVEALLAEALARSGIDPADPQRLLIKSIVAKQMPRNPRR